MLVTCVTAMKVTYLTDSHSKSNYLTKLDLKQNGAILTFPGLVRRNVWKLCGPHPILIIEILWQKFKPHVYRMLMCSNVMATNLEISKGIDV